MPEIQARTSQGQAGVICVVNEGRIMSVSPNTEAISGFPPEYFQGKHVTEVIHPDDVAVVEKFLEPGWTGVIHAAVRVKQSDGGWGWRVVDGVRQRDDSGRHTATVTLRPAF